MYLAASNGRLTSGAYLQRVNFSHIVVCGVVTSLARSSVSQGAPVPILTCITFWLFYFQPIQWAGSRKRQRKKGQCLCQQRLSQMCLAVLGLQLIDRKSATQGPLAVRESGTVGTLYWHLQQKQSPLLCKDRMDTGQALMTSSTTSVKVLPLHSLTKTVIKHFLPGTVPGTRDTVVDETGRFLLY